MIKRFYRNNENRYIKTNFQLIPQQFLIVLALSASILAAQLSACITVQKSEREQWAVIVGVGENENLAFDPLYADSDALAFYSQLEPILGADHIFLLLGMNATKSDIKNGVLNWLAPRENSNDVILIFFSSHGNGDFLQVFDSLKGSSANDISSLELSQWMDTLESTNILLILDACESGNFGNNISESSGVILASSSGREKSWQLDIYEHGVFSYYLIDALKHQRAVDTNSDGYVSAEELFAYTNQKVEYEFEQYPPPSPQHPSMVDNHKGQLILFPVQR